MFKRFFARDYSYFKNKGMTCLAENRYAEARQAFLQALEKLDESTGQHGEAQAELHARIAETGNQLGQMNLLEAQNALKQGNAAKAREHVMLLLELAGDPALRARATEVLASLHPSDAPVKSESRSSHCGGCSSERAAADDLADTDSHLSPRERFELMTQPLPGGLGERYQALGEKFASGFLLMHEGGEVEGAKILRELLEEHPDDILLYELAIFEFRKGNAALCEEMLRRALDLNPANPLCHLGLVQLLADTGRFAECIAPLQYMIEHGMLLEQASVFLGDVYHRMGRQTDAIDSYAKGLEYPQAAKTAAERLLPLLNELGRPEEAAFLAKKYLKGCC